MTPKTPYDKIWRPGLPDHLTQYLEILFLSRFHFSNRLTFISDLGVSRGSFHLIHIYTIIYPDICCRFQDSPQKSIPFSIYLGAPHSRLV